LQKTEGDKNTLEKEKTNWMKNLQSVKIPQYVLDNVLEFPAGFAYTTVSSVISFSGGSLPN